MNKKNIYTLNNNKNYISVKPGQYVLSDNYNDTINNVNKIASNNIGFLARDGYGINPDSINFNSEIRQSELTNQNNINQLFSRTIGTLPVMTKKLDLNADALFNSPEFSTNNKSFNTVTEHNFDRFIPLVSHLKNNIQNTKHIIQEDSLINNVHMFNSKI